MHVADPASTEIAAWVEAIGAIAAVIGSGWTPPSSAVLSALRTALGLGTGG